MWSDHADRVSDGFLMIPPNLIPPRSFIIAFNIFSLFLKRTGLQELTNYLRKEYSHENIRFWLATNQLRSGPASCILQRVQEIYQYKNHFVSFFSLSLVTFEEDFSTIYQVLLIYSRDRQVVLAFMWSHSYTNGLVARLV